MSKKVPDSVFQRAICKIKQKQVAYLLECHIGDQFQADLRLRRSHISKN